MDFSFDWDTLKPWLIGLWVLYMPVMAGWIVMKKREPIATLSWVLSLAALPWIGLLIYHFLGPQRIVRQQRRRSLSRRSLEPVLPNDLVTSDDCATVSHLAQTITHFAPSSAVDVKLLVGGKATYAALHAAIAAAKHHLHLEYYIFEPDQTGTPLRDALVAKAREGVRVRLLLDAVGSAKLSKAFLAPLLDAGVEVGWFHPVKLRRIWRPRINLRNHRKIVVVDGCVAFTGGINITDEEDERRRDDAYRDLHLRLEGNVVHELQTVFAEDWAYATGRAPRMPLAPPAVTGTTVAQVLVSGPDSTWEPIHRLHVSAIHAARQRVWLVTPYFVPGEAARMALTSAALGGLDVRLLVPRRSDSRLVTFAARSYFDELLEAGVRIYEYGPRMLHTKALLCDDDLAIIGSANFDHRSFRLNFELSVLFRDTALAQRLAKLIRGECALASPVRRDRPRGLWTVRLPEAMARLVSPLL